MLYFILRLHKFPTSASANTTTNNNITSKLKKKNTLILVIILGIAKMNSIRVFKANLLFMQKLANVFKLNAMKWTELNGKQIKQT